MFGVVWTDAAMDELADIWVTCPAAERDGVEAAVHRLDARLRADPYEVGESRESDDHRVGFEGPLTVWFALIPDRVARVSHVRKYR